jgi:large subunit ribosomal protein L23
MKKEIYDIIVKPMLTEKSLWVRDRQNRYSFVVHNKATKPEIKEAVEKLFKVKVLKVHTAVLRGKLHRMGRFEGFKPDWKKAVVTLKEGDKIDVAQT